MLRCPNVKGAVLWATLSLASFMLGGHAFAQLVPIAEMTPEQLDQFETQWRDSCELVAEEYFQQPLTIALCHAIERNDLEEVKRLIEDGADVNARGKHDVTPLLWAMPFRRLERFTLLLEAGADPNVPLATGKAIPCLGFPGATVTLTAAKSLYPDLFGIVLDHGGDLKAHHPHFGQPLLHMIVGSPSAHKRKRVLLYKKAGGDMNVVDAPGSSAAMYAHVRNDNKLAVFLLEQGVDPGLVRESTGDRLIDVLARKLVHDLSFYTPQMQQEYFALIDYLETRGFSFEEALEETRFDVSLYRKLREEPALAKKFERYFLRKAAVMTLGIGALRTKSIGPCGGSRRTLASTTTSIATTTMALIIPITMRTRKRSRIRRMPPENSSLPLLRALRLRGCDCRSSANCTG